MLLSPEQFTRLTEYAAYSSHQLKDMLVEFEQEGIFYKYLSDDLQTIDFEGMRHFLTVYFGAELPPDLVEQLFLSFLAKPTSKNPQPDRRCSVFEDTLNSVRTNLYTLGEKLEKLTSSHDDKTIQNFDGQRIPLKPLVCYLQLLEGASPENKLEVVFHVYDSDCNGYLDKAETEAIIEQMMNVAKHLQWDTSELEPILRQMMSEIDYDNDGIVSLDEWKRGGMTTIPLLVLLGFDTEMKEDGSHLWKLRHFSKPTYCHVCKLLLVGWGGKQGLSCSVCKYTVHSRCVRNAETCCIRTFSNRQTDTMAHHWIDANAAEKCAKCRANVGAFQGKRCRWCHNTVHSKCLSQWPDICDLGALSYHILPPSHIFPAFLERKTIKQPHSTNLLQERDGGCSPRTPRASTSTTSGEAHKELSAISPRRPTLRSRASTLDRYKLIQAISPGTHCRPLLCLINPKSGGKQGVKVLRKLEFMLNPRQVYDISKTGPEPGLQLFSTIQNCHVLVCGGDGTIGWVLEAMDKISWEHGRPPVAVLPLGTGNDLARCLRWGGGYENESLQKILHSIEKAQPMMMDRWQIKIEQRKRSDKGDPPPYSIINNYFSIGVDASIAHRFHVMREKYPEKFNSRMRNKLWYFELGTTETLSATCKNLHEQIDILCDGETLDLGNGPTLEGIALLNIASIYGGSNLWGRSRKPTGLRVPLIFATGGMGGGLQHRVQDIGDGLIEVVGLESATQIGQIKAGVRAAARRLSQCSTVVIQTHKPFPMQIDGEPWMQPPCIIQITHMNQVPMLVANSRKSKSWNLLRRQPPSEDN